MRKVYVNYFFNNALFNIFPYYLPVFDPDKLRKTLAKHVFFKKPGKFFSIERDRFVPYLLETQEFLE